MSFSTDPTSLALAESLFQLHEHYKEKTLTHPRFRHRDLVPLLNRLRHHPDFAVNRAGKSVEERDIFLVRVGQGPKKVLLWSQMHGNEPTATMALFDFFNFLADDGELAAVRAQILAGTTIYILPMLNPDGAERFQRNNALGIDLNRDARRLASPEAQLLHETCLALRPDFGFNLHDMDYRHSVGDTGQPATISFLAPPADQAKQNTPCRIRAIQLISHLHQFIEPYIPGRIGRWPDDFEARAFGDTIQAMGTSVVLLEAGGAPGDEEKQYVRHLTFMLLVSGLQAIAGESYLRQEKKVYEQIPENGPLLHDLIVRQVKIRQGEANYTLDLGITREDLSLPGSEERLERGEILERGDLTVPHAYTFLDAENMDLRPGKIFPGVLPDENAVAALDLMDVLRQGFLYVRVHSVAYGAKTTPFPVNLLVGEQADLPEFEREKAASFVLELEGKPVIAVVNGFVHDLRMNHISGRYNSLVYVN